MARHTITLNHPNQVEIGFDDGRVTIQTEADIYIFDFADESFAYGLIGAIANAREWKANAERAHEERATENDHWFELMRKVCGR